jgi:hypothetical protein
MGLLQKLETEIAYSREKVLAPLLLLPPSDSLSKQVILAYLKSQKDIYQLILESTKNLNRFEQELLPSLLIRGCETLENILSLLNDRSRLKFSHKESPEFKENLLRINSKILQVLTERPKNEGSTGSLTQDITSSDVFVKMLMKEDQLQRQAPLYLDIMDIKGQIENDPIFDYKLNMEARQIKAHQAKLNRVKSEVGPRSGQKGPISLGRLDSDGELKLTLKESEQMKVSDSKDKLGTISSINEEPTSFSKKTNMVNTPGSIGSFSNFAAFKSGDKLTSIPSPDLAHHPKVTAQFLPPVQTFGFIESPNKLTSVHKNVPGVFSFKEVHLVNKVALPVVLFIFSIKMKKLFFKRCKADLATALRDLEKALVEERLKNEALVNALSESKNSIAMKQNTSLGPVKSSSNLFGCDQGRFEIDLPQTAISRGSLTKDNHQRESSQASMNEAQDGGSIREEGPSDMKSKIEFESSAHKLLGSLRFNVKPTMKFSIKELSEVLQTIQSEERLNADTLSTSKELTRKKPFYSEQKQPPSNAKQTAIHYRNLAHSLASHSSSLFPMQPEVFRRTNPMRSQLIGSKSPFKDSEHDFKTAQSERSPSKQKQKSLSSKKMKVSSFMTNVSKKKLGPVKAELR